MNPRALWESLAQNPTVLAIWAARIVGVGVLTALLGYALRRLGRARDRLASFFQRALHRRGGGLVERSADILYRAVRTLLGVVRVAVSLGVVYLWLASVTIILDPSRRLFVLVVAPLVSAFETVGTAAVDFIPHLMMLVVIVAVARFATRMTHVFADAVTEGDIELSWLDADAVEPTRRLVTIAIWLLALVMGAPYLPGSHSRAFQGIGLAVGVLVSLGSGSAAGNLLAGLVLMYARVFRPGDRIKIGETVGDVVALGAFTTRLRTIKDEEIVIPNSIVQQSAVTNFSRYAREAGVQISTRITIGYETPWRKVHELLLRAARSTDGIETTPAAYVLQRGLGDFYVTYEICAFSKNSRDLHLVEARLCQAIQDSFFAEGVEICSPHYTSLRDGSRAAIPPQAHASPEGSVAPRRPGSPLPT